MFEEGVNIARELYAEPARGTARTSVIVIICLDRQAAHGHRDRVAEETPETIATWPIDPSDRQSCLFTPVRLPFRTGGLGRLSDPEVAQTF